MNHPTFAEIREWKRRLHEEGFAATGMVGRIIEGYEALWRVMLSARRARKLLPETGSEEASTLEMEIEARGLLDGALEPFAELEPEQMELGES